jgi:hypothetical protein
MPFGIGQSLAPAGACIEREAGTLFPVDVAPAVFVLIGEGACQVSLTTTITSTRGGGYPTYPKARTDVAMAIVSFMLTD